MEEGSFWICIVHFCVIFVHCHWRKEDMKPPVRVKLEKNPNVLEGPTGSRAAADSESPSTCWATTSADLILESSVSWTEAANCSELAFWQLRVSLQSRRKKPPQQMKTQICGTLRAGRDSRQDWLLHCQPAFLAEHSKYWREMITRVFRCARFMCLSHVSIFLSKTVRLIKKGKKKKMFVC